MMTGIGETNLDDLGKVPVCPHGSRLIDEFNVLALGIGFFPRQR